MLVIGALLTACSAHYDISTNLDPENFREHFAASQVTIYQDEQDFSTKFRPLGLVEGQDCQVKAHHAMPDPIAARTRARKQAFEKGANGIIFSPCVAVESPSCTALLVCYGQAFQIEPN